MIISGDDALDPAIVRVMEGRTTDADKATGRAAVQQLRSRGVDGIILGCTELPLLLGQAADEDRDLLTLRSCWQAPQLRPPPGAAYVARRGSAALKRNRLVDTGVRL